MNKKLSAKEFIIVTTNKNKLSEIKNILGMDFKSKALEIQEIQSLSLDEVVTAKAKSAYSLLKKPVIVEDVSFEIKALKGLPGTFIKFFLQTLGTEGTVSLINNNETKATAIAAYCLFDGRHIRIFKGSVNGTLTNKNKGISGFGFDRIFIPNGHKKTYAQMSAVQKNHISHRAKALNKVKNYLDSIS